MLRTCGNSFTNMRMYRIIAYAKVRVATHIVELAYVVEYTFIHHTQMNIRIIQIYSHERISAYSHNSICVFISQNAKTHIRSGFRMQSHYAHTYVHRLCAPCAYARMIRWQVYYYCTTQVGVRISWESCGHFFLDGYPEPILPGSIR